jgi:hypothetical protein
VGQIRQNCRDRSQRARQKHKEIFLKFSTVLMGTLFMESIHLRGGIVASSHSVVDLIVSRSGEVRKSILNQTCIFFLNVVEDRHAHYRWLQRAY